MNGIVYDTVMLRIVIDTNVLVSALRSRRGASYRLLSLVGTGRFDLSVSVPLVLEYESTTKCMSRAIGLTHRDIDYTLDYLCHVGDRQRIFYLWRPYLRDPRDDMVLELAVASEADYVVANNARHFGDIERFGIEAVSPGQFLREIGATE